MGIVFLAHYLTILLESRLKQQRAGLYANNDELERIRKWPWPNKGIILSFRPRKIVNIVTCLEQALPW
jgi:hypothetical protein